MDETDKRMTALEDKIEELKTDIEQFKRTFRTYYLDAIIERFEDNEKDILLEAERFSSESKIIKKELAILIEKMGLIDSEMERTRQQMSSKIKDIENLMHEKESIEQDVKRLRKDSTIKRRLLDELSS